MRDRLRDMRIEWKRSANIKGVPGGKNKDWRRDDIRWGNKWEFFSSDQRHQLEYSGRIN